MPDRGKTPRQTVRVEKDLWDKAGEALGPRKRGAAIRDFLRWLTHETNELPQRPPAPGATAGQNEPPSATPEA